MNVPRDRKYLSFPYLGNDSKRLEKDLSRCLSRFFPTTEFKFAFTNSLKIGNFFPFKDRLPDSMRSSVVYQFQCPRCERGSYIGSTSRMLRVRVSEHLGFSYRTDIPFSNPEASPITAHAATCKIVPKAEHFKIIDQASDHQGLLILESLRIKEGSPHLNRDRTAYPLLISS
jgi:hypothetical protein